MRWIKMFLQWLVLSVFLIAAEIVAYILTPFVVAFADRDSGKLPRGFRWMETPTEPLPGDPSITGIWVERYGWYWAAVFWLWRNSVYGLADIFRVDPDFDTWVVRFWNVGNKAVSDTQYTPGYFFGTMKWVDRVGDVYCAFELRIVIPMPFHRCCMIRAGWKLSSWFDDKRPTKPTATGMLQGLSLRPLLARN